MTRKAWAEARFYIVVAIVLAVLVVLWINEQDVLT